MMSIKESPSGDSCISDKLVTGQEKALASTVDRILSKKNKTWKQRSPAWTEDCDPSSQPPPTKMRQLKGKPKKETSKDKKERKQAMQEARQQITTVVLPTLAVVVLLIVVFVYVATRPAATE